VLAAAGHGKTALTSTAAGIVEAHGREVVALAATNKAVAELRAAHFFGGGGASAAAVEERSEPLTRYFGRTSIPGIAQVSVGSVPHPMGDIK